MSSWERFGDWIATVAVASLAWVSGLVAPGGPAGAPAAIVNVPVDNQLASVMRWAQEDEPPIEQVGEETGEDVETLDDAAPPPDELETAEDVELLDQGSPAADEQDVELLDRGSQALTVTESVAPTTVSTVPVSTYTAPTTSSVPVLPEGFGTGDVHVATGSAGFPVGLEDCHVGAVTGRAYVGVDCGDSTADLVVGHAPSFEEFPFVLEDNFPFDRDSVFADQGASHSEDSVKTQVSAACGITRDETAVAPEIRTSGPSWVEFEQRARDRKPRVETGSGGSKRGEEKRRSGSGGVTASESQDAVGSASTESKQKKKSKGKDRVRRAQAGDDNTKSAKSNGSKKHSGKKGKKKQASN